MRKEVVTVFPKGTVVKYDGEPCELLIDTPYFSARIQDEADKANNTSICTVKLGIAISALKALSCLGNGNLPGNSIGNQMAQDALYKLEEPDA